MTLTDIARLAWGDIRPDAVFIDRLLTELRAFEDTGYLEPQSSHRRSWLVAGAIAGVVGAGIAAFEVHRLRRKRTAA